jgi:hypothetical protein
MLYSADKEESNIRKHPYGGGLYILTLRKGSVESVFTKTHRGIRHLVISSWSEIPLPSL